jgi:hypothetical protein
MVVYEYYEYRTRKLIISANSPVASARANPRIAKLKSWPRSAGFRAVEAISDEKIDPIPIPAPVTIYYYRLYTYLNNYRYCLDYIIYSTSK